MNTTAPSPTPHTIALESVVSRIEVAERQRRVADAGQVVLYAEALDQASPDHFGRTRDGASGGTRAAELAYRSLRAELALATGHSETAVDRRLSHAYELTTHYRETLKALSYGELSLAHTEIIIAAGRVIGECASVATVTRRNSYEAAVLPHALVETPARLRPIARRLAEQYAAQTIDERHAEACAGRRVWVVEREDGMSDLTAHISTVEAYAIYDRLTRASKELAHIEQREQAEQALQAE